MHAPWFAAAFSLAVSLALSCTPASAIVYDETFSGDLRFYTDPGPIPAHVLDAGLNQVSGRLAFGSASDFDAFHFTLPQGYLLEAVSFVMTPWEGRGVFDEAGWALVERRANQGEQLARVDIAIPGTGRLEGLPVGPGPLYSVETYKLSGNVLLPGLKFADYTMSLSVAPVPEPDTVLMLLGGLAWGGWLARRLRQRDNGA